MTSCCNIAYHGDNEEYVLLEDPGDGVAYDGCTVQASELNVKSLHHDIKLMDDENEMAVYPEPISTPIDPATIAITTATALASFASAQTIRAAAVVVSTFIGLGGGEDLYVIDTDTREDRYLKYREIYNGWGSHEGINQVLTFSVEHSESDVITLEIEPEFETRGINGDDWGMDSLEDEQLNFTIGDPGGGGCGSGIVCPDDINEEDD